MDLGKVGNKIANIATLGAYDPLRNIMGGNANKYRADEAAYDPMIGEAGGNNLALQKMLMEQANGGGPNLGQQQFQNATQQLQNQAASQIGSIKGISPAAQARLIQQQQAQVGQSLAGESALQRMQQQLLAQQQLGQNSMGMYGAAVGGKSGAQNVNAAVTSGNTKAQTDMTGGLITGIGGAIATKGIGGKADGGYIEPMADGPQSELGRALMGMASGGPVFAADGHVPGQAVVAGDSPTNDVVPAALSPGEIVIPRTHAHSPEAAASFVEALQRKQGGYANVARARAYADGGEVEEPGLFDRAGAWMKQTGEEMQGKALGVAADALPDVLGGKFKKQLADRRADADAAAKGE
jgi:hypothetical protein